MRVVDPLNPIPKYLQISAWLKELIQTGRFKTGEKLPSEMALSKICKVNRNTLRQAIGELVSQGVLRKEKGTGTFVASLSVAVKHKLKRISSFGDDLKEIGFKEKTIILKKGIERVPEPVAKRLILNAGSQIIAIRRLRTGDDIPLIYEESFLPVDMFKDIVNMDLTGSMYKLISKRFNTVLDRCEQSIKAVNLKKKIAIFLNVPENSAGLFMESITYNESNVPIEVLFSYYRGDKYILEIELGRYPIRENHVNMALEG